MAVRKIHCTAHPFASPVQWVVGRLQRCKDAKEMVQPDFMWLTASNEFDACYTKPA
jgi:hypothetical protein